MVWAYGIRPYDFKKFQLDNPEEIKRAKKEKLQAKPAQSKRRTRKKTAIPQQLRSSPKNPAALIEAITLAATLGDRQSR